MKIEIPSDCRKAHVLFSGGVDSTLILYSLLLQYANDPEFQIICHGLNMSRQDIKFQRCVDILNVLEHKFNRQILFTPFIKLYILRDFVKMILSVDKGYVFSGCNKVLEFLTPTNYIPHDTPPVRGEPFNEFHIRPFINMDKKEIISYYIKYNILELLNMTYSCGYDSRVACKNCYFCLERRWGLEMCGLDIDS
jgi:7-cyano-7-deazaguanine synthase in queuosine biosynthesis